MFQTFVRILFSNESHVESKKWLVQNAGTSVICLNLIVKCQDVK